jgi:uncharacterized protein YukJ
MLLESKKTTIFDIVTHNTQLWGNPKASNVFFFFDEHLYWPITKNLNQNQDFEQFQNRYVDSLLFVMMRIFHFA